MHRGIAKGAAVVLATAGLIGGGAALANAASGGSSTSTTPSTTTPSNTAPSATPQPRSGSGHHCPGMGGSGSDSGSGYGAPPGGAPSQAT